MELTAQVDIDEALAFLGHRGQALGPDLAARIQRAATLCEAELRPRGVWQALPWEDARLFLTGSDLAAHVAGCSEVVLMAATLGPESELVLRRESALGATDGLLVDACASSLVEQAANQLNRLIVEEAAARGLTATSRYSPGYGDLPLTCQPAFLAACGADRALGLRTTAANMLVPTKSITAVIGLKPALDAEEEGAARKDPAMAAGAPSHSAAAGGAVVPQKAPATARNTSDRSAAAGGASSAIQDRCATCPLAPTCSLRAQGRTCYGNPA
ncbi:MAG: hypothetical protein UCH28_05120 [Adlercreutzia sp.]|nr:hypothetical protein [Adlercreutzia sp.]